MGEVAKTAGRTLDDHVERADSGLAVLEAMLEHRALAHSMPAAEEGLLRHEAVLILTGAKDHASAVDTLTRMAANPRYATLPASPFGQARAEGNGMSHETLRHVALQSLAVSGNDAQRRYATAQANLDKVRRVVGLARSGSAGVRETFTKHRQV